MAKVQQVGTRNSTTSVWAAGPSVCVCVLVRMVNVIRLRRTLHGGLSNLGSSQMPGGKEEPTSDCPILPVKKACRRFGFGGFLFTSSLSLYAIGLVLKSD